MEDWRRRVRFTGDILELRCDDTLQGSVEKLQAVGTPTLMDDQSMQAPVTDARQTRSSKFAEYRVSQFAVLIAIVNAHFDVVLAPPTRSRARRYTVASVSQGGEHLNVPAFVRRRVEARLAAKRKDVAPAKMKRARKDETYTETRHLLEDLAFLYDVMCTDLPVRGRVERPSINMIGGPGLFLDRGEIKRRGRFIQQLFEVLCGGQGEFCVPRGNYFLREMLTAPDCNAVLQRARNSIGAMQRRAPYVSPSLLSGAPCLPPEHSAALGEWLCAFQ